MKVHHCSYQRAAGTVSAHFTAVVGQGPSRMQIDAIGQAAQACSRVFKPGAEIAMDYTDDLVAFRNVDAVPSIDYISEGDAVLKDLIDIYPLVLNQSTPQSLHPSLPRCT